MREIEVVRYSHVPGINLFFNTVYYRTPHLHSEMEIVMVTEGRMTAVSEKTRVNAEKGDILLFNSTRIHELISANGCTFLCLQIKAENFRGCQSIYNVCFDHDCILSSLSADDLACVREQIYDIAYAYIDQLEGYDLYCHCRVGMLVHYLMEKLPHHMMTLKERAERKSRYERMSRLFDYVDHNYMKKILLSDFAEQEGKSMSYLSHLIKDTLNQSFQEYVSSVRLNAAAEMIMDSPDDKLLDICYASGFSDYRYFCRAFRNRMNMTPEEFRKGRTSAHREEIRAGNNESKEYFHSKEQSIRIMLDLSKLV